MWSLLWPILVVVAANTLYNISAKSTPANVNLFASLSATYLVAMLCSMAIYLMTSEQKNLFVAWSETNWATYVLGVAVVGLELGFLCVYRAGWNISTAQLFASIALTCVLLVVGVFLYREPLTLR